MRRARFEPKPGAMLAIEPRAFGMFFDLDEREEEKPFELRGEAAIVDIRGPLVQHGDWFWDSYDAIQERVGAALASSAKAVILRIDSPGGDALGCFEAARELRARARAAGKPMYAYADGMIASAAYALASAADAIYTPPAAFLGSIGVIQTMVDTVAMDRAMGLNVALIASGARKLDGNPHVPITEDARRETQAKVDQLAGLFFELVSEMRGVSPEAVSGLQAGLVMGTKAVAAKLADGVMTFNELLGMVSSGEPKALAGAETKMDKKELRAALEKMAEGDDDDAKAAKKCLAALDQEEEVEKKDAPKEEGKAEGEPPPAKKDGDGDNDGDAKAIVSLAKQVHSLEAKLAAKEEKEEREKLLAQRPDFSATIRATLMKAPLAQVREAVETWERATVTPTTGAAAITAQGTRGTRQTGEGGDSGLPSEDREFIKEKMGLKAHAGGVKHEGIHSTFRPMSRDEASAFLAKKAVK